ncbi:Linear gramicidin synthase subunit D [Candidatus Magnetaquicoccaceae bacterium FCR-1]|uniref:Linear gramicidin synthase subunit D n=1 Tax=Candidatus Magnetaquiglobus chichijimensis TaxID=3141448 RepID=A0ABQ0CAQ7_9PROT
MTHAPIATLISDLRALGVVLLVDGENLRVSAPRERLTPELRGEMAARKGEILAHLKAEAATSGITVLDRSGTATTIPTGSRAPGDEATLSFAQQRLWFLDQMEKGFTWNIPAALRLTGPLDHAALTRALSALIARHETLRTTFGLAADGATPVQRIAAPAPLDLPVVDLSDLAPEAREAEKRAWIARGEEHLFDLSQGPLIWVTLVKLDEKNHLLLLTLHHIIADGWSLGVLVGEVAALYARETGAAEAPPLPPLPIQYADFASWQRSWLEEGELDRQLAYWQKQLTGAPALLELPTDRPRPAVQGFNGAAERFSFSPVLTANLKKLSLDHRTTLFTTLLTGFAVLLARYSGQTDLVIGSPVANRNRAELEGLIGFFVNTLVLRLQWTEQPTFAALLEQARAVTLEAQSHQDVPFEQLVERLKPARTRSYSPLFQVMFILQNTPEQRLELPGLTIEPLDQEQVPAKYDLLLALEEKGDLLKGEFEYNTDLFDAATIRRMIGHLETLLTAACDDVNQPCARLPLLTPAEYDLMVRQWNRTEVVEPEGGCLHTLIEAQVARTPHAPALVWGDVTLDYQTMNARANQLAHHLIALGVTPGTLIGISVERSPDTVIALLAILKAGGAYVPMDPNHPPERLAILMEDARLKFVVAHASVVSKLPVDLKDGGSPPATPDPGTLLRASQDTAPTLCLLERDAAIIATRPKSNPDVAVQPDHPTYVIYTSGSTGRPKGVVIRHDRLVRMFLVTRAWFDFDAHDIWTLFHGFSFDFSVWEMWGALLFGGKLVVVDGETARSPEAFYALLHRERVTVLNNNPSVFQALTRIEESGGAKPLALRVVIFGAEPLKLQNLKPWFARHGDQRPRLINLYGITESTVHTTYHALSLADLEQPHLRIGPPRAELHPLYILDDHLQPVPIGVPGILYAGGHNLSPGYLNQPELTAKAFLPDPFSDDPEARLQRTGDLARFLPDGNIHFLGRKDYQVKVRGFRIELGEIEANLVRHPDLYEAAATTWEPRPGDKMLVAYVEVRKGHEPPTAEQLRAYLKQKLPDYMVPALFRIMAALPRSPNGKVDRRLLPAPTDEGMAESRFTPPRGLTEELIAATWAELLTLPRVSRDAHFFELGGHSLMATRVLARLKDQFALELPLALLFDHPVLGDLATAIDAARLTARRLPPPPPIRAIDRSGDLPLSFAQQRLWFLEQLEGGFATYHLPGGMALTGPLDLAALTRALRTIVNRHESLRTVFPSVDGNPVQRVLPLFDLPVPLLTLAPGQSLQDLASEQMQRPFDLSSEPMLRASIVQIAPEEHALLFTLHHIASDGWSVAIFITELFQLYNAFAAGAPDPLPPLPIQYADYGHWQQQWLTGALLEQQLTYWKGQLADIPELLELPTDRLRPPVQTYHGADLYFNIDRPTTDRLHALCRATGATLFMTLIGAFATLLGRLSDQTDVVIGTPVANRGRPETEGLIGFFVNTLALRVDLGADPDFATLLTRVRRMTLDGFAHQDIPFEQLVDALQPTRNLSHAPLFQVLFALQNAPFAPPDLAGVTMRALDLYGKSAKFDISLSMEENAEGLSGNFEYNTDLFDATTIERFIGYFTSLLKNIAATPNIPLSRLPIQNAAERELLLETWNANHVDHPHAALCIHQLFEHQAQATPDAIALICDDGRRLTYAQLDAKTNQLAHHLRDLGVGPDRLVGVCLERNQELVVALMAILKAGGAYVPLDPNYPPERIAFMLSDMEKADTSSEGPVLLTQQSILPHLPASRARVVSLDGPVAAPIAARSTSRPEPLATPNHLAYLIYTSGSTGLPKGVAIEHHSTVTLIHWTRTFYERAWFEAVLASTSICFDLSVFELFVTLSWGGRIILARDALALPGVVEAGHQVTLVNTVPSAMAALLRLGPLPDSVRLVILAGEPFKDTLAHAIYANPGVLHFDNLYGPSEDTTYSTCARIPADLRGSPSIGRPIANTKAYILDAHLEPVPIGVTGELYLSGDGLARCYLNRPELTDEKFIPNPFHPEGMYKRMYKTGDLARFKPDGSIDFLGRRDHQVKIRGFRIELGEIENALQQHPEVRESVVVVRSEGTNGENRYLVAYVVPRPGSAPTVGDLRAHLKSRVPEFMVPAVFMLLPDGLPLTANGKLDRKALPDPERSREGLSSQLAAPQSHKEQLLTRLWSEVLGVEQVGIHDNFFELGGDSILSIQIVARARQAGMGLTLRQIFQHQTIAELASVASFAEAVRAEQGIVTGAAPLTAIQRWFLERATEAPHHFNQAHLLVTPPHLDPEALRGAIGELLRWHDALRLRFFRDPSGWRQELAEPDETIPFTREDLSALPADGWHAAIETRASQLQASLDPSRGPLLRAALFQGADDQPGRLLFIIHHLAIDGISWRILLEDLQTLLDQAARREPFQLPAKTTSFKQWAERITAPAHLETLRAELPYWQSLADRTFLPLPHDQGSPDQPSLAGSVAHLRVSLDTVETNALLHELPGALNARINDLLLTALARALSLWSGQKSGAFLIDLEGHGREELFEDLDISRTVGWFTALYPVALEAVSDDSWPAGALNRIQERLAAVPKNGIGFGLLRHLLDTPSRQPPTAQISFNYFGQYDGLLGASNRFTLAQEAIGPTSDPRAQRSHLLELNGFVGSGVLHWDWSYDPCHHHADSIQRLGELFLVAFREMIQYGLESESLRQPAEDAAATNLDGDDLDALLAELS